MAGIHSAVLVVYIFQFHNVAYEEFVLMSMTRVIWVLQYSHLITLVHLLVLSYVSVPNILIHSLYIEKI